MASVFIRCRILAKTVSTFFSSKTPVHSGLMHWPMSLDSVSGRDSSAVQKLLIFLPSFLAVLSALSGFSFSSRMPFVSTFWLGFGSKLASVTLASATSFGLTSQ